ncbi:MAG: hypothetical protein EZS28_034773 [Streblomastix strix]|uniref:Uncharacterized protein n=1 Tax=Streblomastix strix TaxID=222440 RepID=A0A5J4UGJ8_9EUKA|nr:MAG: hypothetical protein EZS28_034773 [Streblomastix strix]
MNGWTDDYVELSGTMKKTNGVEKQYELSMCIECIECIGSQAESLDSRHIRHNALKLVKWKNNMNCPCVHGVHGGQEMQINLKDY